MEKSERKMAAVAGEEYHRVTPVAKVEHKEGLSDLFRSKALRRRLLVLWVLSYLSPSFYPLHTHPGHVVHRERVQLRERSKQRCHLRQFLPQPSAVLRADRCLQNRQSPPLSRVLLSPQALVILDTAVPQFNRRHLHQGAQSGVIICFLLLTVLLALSHQVDPYSITSPRFRVLPFS